MDLAAKFMREATGREECASAVVACIPSAGPFKTRLSGMDRTGLSARTDALAIAGEVASAIGAREYGTVSSSPAWGVAEVNGRHTFCLWDGRTLWVQGARGAARIPARFARRLWELR